MTLSSDETQPKSPFRQQQDAPFVEPEPQDTGPGCLIWGIVGGICLVIALAIVGLAGAAGWTTGQRVAHIDTTATQDGVINNQVNKIATEIWQGNTELIEVRVNALVEMMPDHPQVGILIQTATAHYLTSQPTVTPTSTETSTPTETSIDQPTQEPTAAITANANGRFDPAGLLNDARRAINERRLDDAINTLEVIITIDPNFQRSTITQLIIDTLSTRALELYRGGDDTQLARAIRLTDRIEYFGPLPPNLGLGVEREAATLYLNAKATIGTSDFTMGLRYLEDLRRLAPNYRAAEIQRLLISQYTIYGDSLVAQGQPCSAVIQYNNALNVAFDGVTTGKRDAAQITCEQGTPTPEGFIDPENPTPAPIGSQGG
jgi:hypothetical protein